MITGVFSEAFVMCASMAGSENHFVFSLLARGNVVAVLAIALLLLLLYIHVQIPSAMRRPRAKNSAR